MTAMTQGAQVRFGVERLFCTGHHGKRNPGARYGVYSGDLRPGEVNHAPAVRRVTPVTI